MELGVKGRREWVWRGVRGRSGIIHTLTTGEREVWIVSTPTLRAAPCWSKVRGEGGYSF